MLVPHDAIVRVAGTHDVEAAVTVDVADAGALGFRRIRVDRGFREVLRAVVLVPGHRAGILVGRHQILIVAVEICCDERMGAVGCSVDDDAVEPADLIIAIEHERVAVVPTGE